VHRGATLVVLNSTIRNAGWKDQRDSDEYKYIGPPYTKDYSVFGHGLEINTTAKAFRNNVFENIASIRFYSSNNMIEHVGDKKYVTKPCYVRKPLIGSIYAPRT